jgi:uncharacterized repeat protein (TIGR01451 family)
VNYSWTCSGLNGGASSPACTASYTPPVPVFDLRLKKYINSDDAQPNAPVAVTSGNTFNYIIRVTNDGPANVSGVTTVTDTLPAGIAPNGTISASGWSCTGMTSISCTRSDTIASGVSFPEIVVPVIVTATTGTITNIATVTNPAENPNNPNRTVDNTDPAVITLTPPVSTAFDLSIKKYVDYRYDAQPGFAVAMTPDARFNYVIRVRNEGTGSVSGRTTVRDIIPNGVSIAGIPSGNTWTCSISGRTVTCESNATNIYAGDTFPEIVIPVQVSAIVSGEALNN